MPHHKHAHHLREREVHHVRNAQRQVVDTANVVSVVYVTASKTFDGPVGGYKTLDDFSQKADSNPQQQQTPGPMLVEPTTAAEVKLEPSISPEVQSKPEFRASLNAPAIRNSQDPTTTATPETSSTLASTPASTFVLASLSLSTSIAVESSETRVGTEVHPTSASSAILGVPLATSVVHEFPAANSGLSTPTADASAKSQGMSGAAKAGLAIGLILIIGVAAACVFFFLRRRKGRNESYQKTDDEKTLTHNRGSLARTPSTRSTRTTATAPRLSLRPVTQFLPDLASRSKTANASAPSGGSARSMPDVQGQDLSEKNINSNQSNNSVDPFGDRAEVSDGITLPIQSNTLVNPFGNHAATADHGSSDSMSLPVEAPAPLRVRTPTPETTRAGSDAATSPIGTARDERYKSPNQVNITQLQSGSPAANALPSPTGTEFSTSSASAVPNTHGSSPANVHRVQLDFKPSMDDELELQAGQLVRLLHEYDDGWALCIRLDRSQQGVAPRTCLSARPVKPRPNGGSRGPPVRGPQPVVFGPAHQRPLSPANGRSSPSPYNPESRSMSPGPNLEQRSISPGPYGAGQQHSHNQPTGRKRRSNSASQVRERRNSPPGPSPMNPNAGNMQRIPKNIPAMIAPTIVASQPPPQGMQRKPVPGQAM